MPDTPIATHLADYRAPDFLVDTVALDFELDAAATTVRSRLALRRMRDGADLRLDGLDMTLLSVAVDGAAIAPDAYRVEPEALVIPGLPAACVLEIAVRIAPADNTTMSGLYVSGGAFFTQCEAEGFRRITYFPDRPDVMARFSVTLHADAASCPVLLSNGNPVARGRDGARHWATWDDPHPKPSYLFALVAGDLVAVRDTFRTRSGRDVALAVYVREGDQDKCGHALASLKTSMTWDEDVFGLEYDLDVFNIAAVSDFNMGAMENKGLNIFNTAYVLARPDTATDTDYQSIESVIAHEYFHNWTGNRVTCRDWFQLSLKEGLTVFRDQEFSADQGSRAVKRIGDVRGLRARQFTEDAGPLAHPVRPESYVAIDNFYTATVYQKGAEVIRMMRTMIGPESFRRGMDLYFERHDNSAVRIEDFAAAMQDASGVDLTAFKRWYSQAGTPTLTVSDAYDSGTRRYTLTLSQATPATPGQPDKQPLVLPVAMGLLGPDGGELPTRLEGENDEQRGTRVLVLDSPRASFTFVDVDAPPVPSLNRGFSAPVKLAGVSPERLRFLAAHDTDLFTRWDSGEQYATQALLTMVAAIQLGGTPEVDAGIIEQMKATLANADADPEAAAQGLMLPSETTLADMMAVADPDAIHAARNQARDAIAGALRTGLRATYDALTDHGPYAIDGRTIGRRALRNAALGYLATGADGIALARAQFETAGNMTDQLAALGALSRADCPERVAALAAFHARWRGEKLVLDKWFSLQAVSPLADADAIRALMRHPDYDPRNPNRVRAVIGAFAYGNQVRFHTADGAGYGLLAETIVAVDAHNPQLAARIVPPLGQWRRFDAARQALMRAALERVLAAPALSRNTHEMALRSLG